MIASVCKNCGKEFQAYPSRKAQYCSSACSYHGQYIRIKINCQYCGKEILSRPDRVQKYCSNKCWSSDRSTKVKVICISCGMVFYRKSCETDKKYCSRECLGLAKRNGKEYLCQVCGKRFYRSSMRSLKKYCSIDCKMIGMHKPSYNKICPICGKVYIVYERDKNSTYCSRKCKHIDKTVIKYCPVCNKKIEVRKSHAPKSVYCGKDCMRIAYREIHMKDGYIKLDNNHHEIVDGLIQLGATVISMAGVKYGVPDILVGYHGKNYLMEIKNNDTRGKLSESQIKWHKSWCGQVCVINSIEQAIDVITQEDY